MMKTALRASFRRAACIAAIALAAVAAAPASADTIDDTIEARRGFFKLLGLNFGGLVAMAKGDVDYDAAQATSLAANLKALASMDPVPLFPAGSDNVAKSGKTRSLPVIWTDFDGFAGAHGDWKTAVDGLAAAAGEGQQALQGAIGPVGQTCSACHDDYRARSF